MSGSDTYSSNKDHQGPSIGISPQIGEAGKAIAAIMTGLNNFAVFPPDHPSTHNMIKGAWRTVNQFSEEYGGLAVDVERHGLIFQEKTIYEGPLSDENPAFVLHRAGISRFEFLPGLEEEELVEFFQIYNHFQVADEESDDDLVSALWRVKLPHIVNEASYELWGDSVTSLGIDTIQTMDPIKGDGDNVVPLASEGWVALRFSPESEEYQGLSLAKMPGGEALWLLGPEEEEALLDLADKETEEGYNQAGIRLMLLMLEQETDLLAYESIVSFLQEAYLGFFGKQNFRKAHFIFDNIRKAFLDAKGSKPWALPALKKFYFAIIKAESLSLAVSAWPKFTELGNAEIEALTGILKQLPSKAGIPLLDLVGVVEDDGAKKMFVDILALYATKDRDVLEAGLVAELEDVVIVMIDIIEIRNDPEIASRYLEKLRYDPRGQVRTAATKVLTGHGFY